MQFFFLNNYVKFLPTLDVCLIISTVSFLLCWIMYSINKSKENLQNVKNKVYTKSKTYNNFKKYIDIEIKSGSPYNLSPIFKTRVVFVYTLNKIDKSIHTLLFSKLCKCSIIYQSRSNQVRKN